VGAQVLVPKAARYLVIAPDAGDHQQLLKLLWRLRKGEEVAGVKPGRHDKVTRPFRCSLEQHRRLDLDEFVAVLVAMDRLADPMPKLERLCQSWPADVEVPISQAKGFIRRNLVLDLERRRLRLGDDLHVARNDFDLAGSHLGVLGSWRPARYFAADPDHILVSQRRRGRSDDDLHRPPSIAEVDECHTAV